MLRLVAVSLLITAAAPAAAQSNPSKPVMPNPQAKENPLDKVICRYEETVGSRLKRHKVCATLREWKDQEDETRQALEKIQQGQGVIPSG